MEYAIKSCSTCLQFQATWAKDKPIPHEIQGKPLETVHADISLLNTKIYLCIVNNLSKSLVMNLSHGLGDDSLIKTGMLIFAEYRLP